jgi:hypothetical protein
MSYHHIPNAQLDIRLTDEHILQEYRDVNRTYGDVAQALSHYSSLSPLTDIYSKFSCASSKSYAVWKLFSPHPR